MRAANCTRKALRVYQARGLVKPVCNVGNHRYDAAALDRLRLIVSLRAIDLSLDEIATVLAARDARTGGANAASASRDVEHLIGRISDRISGLEQLRTELHEARSALDACAPCEQPPTACGVCVQDGRVDNHVARTLLVHGS